MTTMPTMAITTSTAARFCLHPLYRYLFAFMIVVGVLLIDLVNHESTLPAARAHRFAHPSVIQREAAAMHTEPIYQQVRTEWLMRHKK